MFEILSVVPDGVAVKSIYRASLELYRRARLGNWRNDHDIDPPGHLPSPLDPLTASEAQVIGQVLDEIESVERKPLRELPEQAAGKYISQLSRILMDRIRSQPDSDPERGKALLEELRRDYGPGYRHRAA